MRRQRSDQPSSLRDHSRQGRSGRCAIWAAATAPTSTTSASTEQVPLSRATSCASARSSFASRSVAAAKPADAGHVLRQRQPEKPRKQPPVKDVADVVQRTISKSSDSTSEDDISRWLLGMADTNGEATLKETRTIRLEETKAHGRIPATSDPAVAETVEMHAGSSAG